MEKETLNYDDFQNIIDQFTGQNPLLQIYSHQISLQFQGLSEVLPFLRVIKPFIA